MACPMPVPVVALLMKACTSSDHLVWFAVMALYREAIKWPDRCLRLCRRRLSDEAGGASYSRKERQDRHKQQVCSPLSLASGSCILSCTTCSASHRCMLHAAFLMNFRSGPHSRCMTTVWAE